MNYWDFGLILITGICIGLEYSFAAGLFVFVSLGYQLCAINYMKEQK